MDLDWFWRFLVCMGLLMFLFIVLFNVKLFICIDVGLLCFDVNFLLGKRVKLRLKIFIFFLKVYFVIVKYFVKWFILNWENKEWERRI